MKAFWVKKMKLMDTLIQFIKFGLVGLSNTIISLMIYYVLIALEVKYGIATICGYIGSSIMGYFLNKLWVFYAKKESITKSVIRYYIVYGSALLINLVCMYLWVEILGISEKIAPILTLFITIPYNYILSKVWVFKKTEKEGK